MKILAMIGWMGLLAIQAKANGIHADSLKVDCAGTLKLEQTVKAEYHPGKPAQWRFPGTEPSEIIEFKASFQKLNGTQCSLLDTKYKLDLKKQIHVFLSPKPVQSQAHVEAVARDLVGTEASFHIEQSFGYQTESGYLPLFPEIVSEDMSLTGLATKTGESLEANLPIDVQNIYGTNPVEQWGDDQKVNLAKQLALSMGDISRLGNLNDFSELFLSLQARSQAAQKTLFQIIWKKMNEAAANPYTRFFDFEGGGDGAFVGHPFASKLNQAANVIATSSEKEQLIFQFPSLLQPGGFAKADCLNVTPENLEHAMKEWQDQAPILLNQHFYKVKEMLQLIAVDGAYWLNNMCVNPLKTEANRQLAKEILTSFLK